MKNILGILAGHWESLLDVRNLDWTLEILAGRSKSWLDVRNLGRTFEVLAGNLEKWKSKIGGLGSKKLASRIPC